jgi:hypothetical protein
MTGQLSVNEIIVESAMRLPRSQFTIRRLSVLIAGCAIGLAILRTSYDFVVVSLGVVGSVFVSVGVVLPGFLIAKARGGGGVIGGALSASVICPLLVMPAVLSFPFAVSDPFSYRELMGVLVFTCAAAVFAFIFGLLVSGALYLIYEVTYILWHLEPCDRTRGPRRWHNELLGECGEE